MKNLKVRTKLYLILALAICMVVAAIGCGMIAMADIRDLTYASFEEEARSNYDNLIQSQVENVISLLEQYNEAYKAGECTFEEAKKQAADMVRELRYGDNGYFWVDDLEGNNIVLLGNETEGTNRYNALDANGYPFIQEIIKVAKQADGGFCDFVFPKEGQTQALPKRGYAKVFEPFGWVIGTGNYTDDIDTKLAFEKEEIEQSVQKWVRIMTICAMFF